MTVAARERRIQAVKLADALNAIEGVPVSEYAKMLSHCWANGDLTGGSAGIPSQVGSTGESRPCLIRICTKMFLFCGTS